MDRMRAIWDSVENSFQITKAKKYQSLLLKRYVDVDKPDCIISLIRGLWIFERNCHDRIMN